MKKALKVFALSIGTLVVAFIAYFFIIRIQDNRAINMKGFQKPVAKNEIPILLPSTFLNGQRFYIRVSAVNGDTLLAFGDTGGGISMILPNTLDKLKLQDKIKLGIVKGIMPVNFIYFSDVVADPKIPSPENLRTMAIRHPFKRITEPILLVPKMDDELRFMTQKMNFDIFLGQNFFMSKSWTFDYIKQQIWVNTPIEETSDNDPNVQKLGFKRNGNNEAIFGHPSLQIELGGDKIDVLFDSGASIVLSKKGKEDFHTSQNTIGGSFMAASIFNQLRSKHPDWKCYSNATVSGSEIIEVPILKIGTYAVGPVIFEKRPDEAWSKNMIQSMNKVVKGAIGGSVLQYFKVKIDYKSSLIKLER